MRQGQWIRAELREVFKPGQFVDIKLEIFDCFRDPSLLARILVRRHWRQIVQILEVQVLAGRRVASGHQKGRRLLTSKF